MKLFSKIGAVCVAFAATAAIASATPISGTVGFAGLGTYSGGTNGTFTPNPTTGNNAFVLAPGTGTLTPFVSGTAASFSTFTAGSIPTGTTLFTSTVASTVLYFTYTATSMTSVDSTGNGILISGLLHETGFDDTVGTLDISGNGNTALFTAGVNAAATPEPSSLVLIGTGLFGVASAAYRRRKMASAS